MNLPKPPQARPKIALPKPPQARVPTVTKPQPTLVDQPEIRPQTVPPMPYQPPVARTIPDEEPPSAFPTVADEELAAEALVDPAGYFEAPTLADEVVSTIPDEYTRGDDGVMMPVSSGAEPDLLSPGKVLAGRYAILELIGKGGMAQVYKARDLRFKGQVVAIKCLHFALSANPVVKQRFHNEAVLARGLNHPNVVQIYDIFESEAGFLCIAMAFLEGQDFRSWLAANRSKETFLPQALTVVRDACSALEHAHRHGAVHRDVKPENIFVTRENRVLMMDFGIAKLLQEIDGTQGYATTHLMTQSVVGTPAYMAPEQFESGAEIDGRADQYAMGVVLYETLTGRLPSGRFKLPSEIVPGLGKFYDGLIERSLSQDKAQRFANMGEFLNELKKSPHLPKGGGGLKLSPLALTALGLVVGAVVLLVLFYLQHSLLLWALALALLIPVGGFGLVEWMMGSPGQSREAKTVGKMLCFSGIGLFAVGMALLLEKTL